MGLVDELEKGGRVRGRILLDPVKRFTRDAHARNLIRYDSPVIKRKISDSGVFIPAIRAVIGIQPHPPLPTLANPSHPYPPRVLHCLLESETGFASARSVRFSSACQPPVSQSQRPRNPAEKTVKTSWCALLQSVTPDPTMRVSYIFLSSPERQVVNKLFHGRY